jgi:hypothetical protein
LAVLAQAVKLAAESWDKQIFIATHSPVLLSQFDAQHVLVVEVEDRGSTVLRRLSEIEEVQDLLEDYSTGSLYMAEMIGPQGPPKATSPPERQTMKPERFPPGWDEERVRKLLKHYEEQTEEEAVAEDEAAFEDRTQTVMVVPTALVPPQYASALQSIEKRQVGINTEELSPREGREPSVKT